MKHKPLVVMFLLLLFLNGFTLHASAKNESGTENKVECASETESKTENGIGFSEFGSLHPQYRRGHPWEQGRSLLFWDTSAKKLIETDVLFKEMAIRDPFPDLGDAGIVDGYWDPRTRKNIINTTGNQWFLIEKAEDSYTLEKDPKKNFSSRAESHNRIVMDDGDILTLVRNPNNKIELTIVNPETNTTYFRLMKTDVQNRTNVVWIDGGWIFMEQTVLAGGFGTGTDVVMNYKGKREHSLYPDIHSLYPNIIVGYGNNLIMTTSNGLKGFTVQEVNNPYSPLWIIYQDLEFDLCGMLPEWAYNDRVIGFCTIDLPYVYIPVYTKRDGQIQRYCYVILDLQTNKARASPQADMVLIGIFDDGRKE
ncbi:MAG: hypothetical protein LBH35_06800 [Treponema sp.]|jgi:hypothetical protein|nr:hypothetical protein [Treponema sp.]